MNPVEIGKGKSFKGLAAYLLHDTGRAQTAARVGWSQSFNLDGADADRAWKLMAATAMSADKLKAAAGIKKGKPVANTVYHLALSFNPEDRPDEAVQRAAVTGALSSLGLEQYQALAISHTDTAQTHVHVMVNLIHPENGVSAASKQPGGGPSPLSFAQKKLSKWAQGFEREHGLAVTEGRLANANKRAQGEKVDARRKPRHVWERERDETTDRRRDFTKQRFEDQGRELTAESRAMHEQHRSEWDGLKGSYKAEKTARQQAHKEAIPELIHSVKQRNKPHWRELFARQRDEMRVFDRGEHTAIGRIWHAAAVFRDRALSGDALGGLVAAFSKEERRNIIARKHDEQRKHLGADVADVIACEIRAARRDQAAERNNARVRYFAACDELRARQAEERAAMRDKWKAYNAGRAAALAKVRARSVERDLSQSRGRGRGIEPH